MRTRTDSAGTASTAAFSSVRTSLRTGRTASAGLSTIAVIVAGALVWALASVSPSAASPSADSGAVEVASVDTSATGDELVVSDAGLQLRVDAAEATVIAARSAALVEARQAALEASVRAEIVQVAREKIGTPYRAGAAGPDAFDCGGFTQFVYRRALGMEIGRSSVNQYQRVQRVSKKQARPGDLVFFFENGAQHVGIYIGEGKMIDAPQTGQSVKVNPISGSWWGRSFTGIGRVLPA